MLWHPFGMVNRQLLQQRPYIYWLILNSEFGIYNRNKLDLTPINSSLAMHFSCLHFTYYCRISICSRDEFNIQPFNHSTFNSNQRSSIGSTNWIDVTEYGCFSCFLWNQTEWPIANCSYKRQIDILTTQWIFWLKNIV